MILVNHFLMKFLLSEYSLRQKKEFEFRTYEEEVSYSLSDIKFVTSSKNDNGENDYYLLKDLKEYFRQYRCFYGKLLHIKRKNNVRRKRT